MSLILSGTDGLSDVDGTAATPAIRGTDTNTGIFFPAADTVAASVGGTEGLRLTTTGLTTQQDATVYGVRVGRGAGAVATNTAVGASALLSNTTGARNTAIGFQSLDLVTTGGNNTAVGYNTLTTLTTGAGNTAVGESALEVTTASFNSAVGKDTLASNSTGANNTAMGYQALLFNTTASNNTAVGYQAGYSNTTGIDNSFFGRSAGESLTTGSSNTFIGRSSGEAITTGGKNSILGRYSGNQGGLDIRTLSNNIVLSDGDGNPRLYFYANQWYLPSRMFVTSAGYFTSSASTGLRFNNEADTQNNVIMYDNGTTWHRNSISVGAATPTTSGAGITFPATQSASSDANTLDDYEEGTWTPGISAASGSGGTLSDFAGFYTKIGNRVVLEGRIQINSLGTLSGAFYITGLPFTSSSDFGQYEGAVRNQGINDATFGNTIVVEALAATAQLRFHFNSDTSTQRVVQVSNVSTGDFVSFGLVYKV